MARKRRPKKRDVRRKINHAEIEELQLLVKQLNDIFEAGNRHIKEMVSNGQSMARGLV